VWRCGLGEAREITNTGESDSECAKVERLKRDERHAGSLHVSSENDTSNKLRDINGNLLQLCRQP
jgi:hypothetical protein